MTIVDYAEFMIRRPDVVIGDPEVVYHVKDLLWRLLFVKVRLEVAVLFDPRVQGSDMIRGVMLALDVWM